MHFQFSGGTWRDGSASFTSRYLLALIVFLVALAARFMLVDILPARGFPFLSFFPAVLVTVYVAGLGPGLLVALLSTLSAWAFFMGPRGEPSAMLRSDVIALVFFVVILIVDCIVIERMNLAMRKLRTTGMKLRMSEDALVLRQAELSEANRQKDVFIAMLAHELRNPLAPILSAAQFITMRTGGDDQVGRAAAIITRQGLQLTRLVDDLLDASRIHSSKLTLQMQPVDLRDVVASALETSAPMIERSASTFTVALPSHPIPVEVDSTRIAQCVSNLLHNAFKFTPGRGKVHLHVGMRPDGMVGITVTDSGRGMSPEILPRLFEMFIQEGKSGSDGNSGLGIGLALTHHLVLRHGGTVSAHSDGPGTGARFEIALPVKETMLDADADADADAGAGTPAAAGAAPHDAAILVVDDNEDAAAMLRTVLQLNGFDVTMVHTGGDALALLARNRYQAVLLDIGLPDMSGYDVASQARGDGLVAADTYMIALTGWSDAASRQRSAEAGIDCHLNKPVAMDDLLERLRSRHPSNRLSGAGREEVSC